MHICSFCIPCTFCCCKIQREKSSLPPSTHTCDCIDSETWGNFLEIMLRSDCYHIQNFYCGESQIPLVVSNKFSKKYLEYVGKLHHPCLVLHFSKSLYLYVADIQVHRTRLYSRKYCWDLDRSEMVWTSWSSRRLTARSYIWAGTISSTNTGQRMGWEQPWREGFRDSGG